MRWAAAGVSVAIQLGGVFGVASAGLETIDDSSMTIQLSVEVRESAEVVVAHLSFDGKAVTTIPLLHRGEGVFGIRTELEPRNYAVVFEAVGLEGGLSDAYTLTDLGVDFTPDRTEPEEAAASETSQIGWLALAAGAAALSALAFWALGGEEEPEGPEENSEEG